MPTSIACVWALLAFSLPTQCFHPELDAGLWPLPSRFQFGNEVCRLGPAVEVAWDHQAARSGMGPHVIGHLTSRLSDYDKHFSNVTEIFDVSTIDSFTTVRIECEGVVEHLNSEVSERYLLTVPQCSSTCFDSDEGCARSDTNEIFIAADTALGVLRAIETLLQLLTVHHAEQSTLVIFGIPWQIEDRPRFPHRGLLLDTSRNFIPVPALLQTIEAMALSKLNVLHWHIVDAPSFPFQSSSAPFLSEHGAYSPEQVYTSHDIQVVISAAFRRGVRVLPEIDMPGHAYAWGLGQPQLTTCSGKQPWERYCAEPPCGQLDPTLNATYEVVAGLLGDVTVAFPDQVLHLGADEVNLLCWEEDDGVRKRMKEGGVRSALELWESFEQRVIGMASGAGRQVVLWQDAWEAGVRLPPSTILQIWKGAPDVGRAVAAGHRVIVSNADAWYLDCGAGSFVDGGRSWCDPFKSWEAMLSHDVLEGVPDVDHPMVLGGEACMWTEQVDEHNLHSKVWPRAAAVAEALWNPAGRGDMAGAKRRLAQHRLRLLRAGVGAAPLHPQWCTRRPGQCDSHAPAQHGSSYGVVEFPSAASDDSWLQETASESA